MYINCEFPDENNNNTQSTLEGERFQYCILISFTEKHSNIKYFKIMATENKIKHVSEFDSLEKSITEVDRNTTDDLDQYF